VESIGVDYGIYFVKLKVRDDNLISLKATNASRYPIIYLVHEVQVCYILENADLWFFSSILRSG
jgi:hypothetical protein